MISKTASAHFLKLSASWSCWYYMDKMIKDDGRSDAKVDLNDPNEISFAAQEAGISSEEYKKYAREAGTNGRQAIARYITEQLKK